MAQAKPSIQQSAAIRITTAAHVLAAMRARQHVKAELQRRGEKVSHYAARNISALAQEYLSEHRSELLPPAIETIERWTLAGEFGKRAQRALSAKLTTNAHTNGHCSNKQIPVQMSGAK
jgi:hypothetical protein